jgi:hypothetical protein
MVVVFSQLNSYTILTLDFFGLVIFVSDVEESFVLIAFLAPGVFSARIQ